MTLGLVTALGLGLRLAWVLSVETDVVRIVDMQWYYVTASNLAGGHGMTVKVIPGMGYVAGAGGFEAVLWPPGYSLTLAAFFKAFGASLLTAKLVNVMAGAGTIVATYLLARGMFDVRTAIIAAVLCAVYPANIIWSSVLYSDVVFALPFALTLAILASVRTPSAAAAIVVGLLVGYAAIIRPPAAILLLVAAAVWTTEARFSSMVRPLTLAALASLAFVVPVLIWNSVRTDSAMLLSQNLGYNLRIGHAPYSTGRYTTPPAEADRQILVSPQHRSDWSQAADALDYAVTHPVRELELSAKKVFYLYTTDSDSVIWATSAGADPIWGSLTATERLQDIADIVSYAIIVLAIASIPVALSRGGRRSILWLTLLLWTAIHIAFFGEPRYHLPVLPILLTLASVSICTSWDALRGHSTPAGDAA